MRRLLLLVILFFNLGVLPSYASGNVIIDRLTTQDAEDLNIVIPYDVPPGFHSITIEVYDDAGTVNEKEIPFCKNLNGEIHWDNICTDVVEIMPLDELLKITDRDELPAYDPAQEPNKSNGLAISAFAALALLSSAAQSRSGGGQGERSDQVDQPDQPDNGEGADGGDEGPDELTEVESEGLEAFEREEGWGDRSRTWRNRYTQRTDEWMERFTHWSSKYSPLLARTSVDGSYTRAIFGSWALASVPLGLLLGIRALRDTGAQALAPSLITVIAIVAIGIIDALGGFVAAVIFFTGVLVTGHITSRGELLTVAGLILIFFAPALLASAVRPLRRLVSNKDEGWERITDYALATLLTGWTVDKMVNALNGFGSVQLPITYKATEIAIASSVFVALRVIGEDIATYHYPVRLAHVTIELEDPTLRQRATTSIFKTFLFLALASPFVGVNVQLLLGALLFVLPFIGDLTIAERLPKFSFVYRLIPQRTFKVIVMVFVGALFGAWMQGLFSSPADFLKWSFVLLAIPGLIFSVLEWISDEPDKDWKESKSGRWTYRILGVIIFLLTVQMVRGVDLSAWILGLSSG